MGCAKQLRAPVDYRYDALNWEFLKCMAQMAHLGGERYKDPRQYTEAELLNDRSPVNHIPEHLRAFFRAEPHDHFGDRHWHLVAIAYNAMMQWFYETGEMPGDVTRPYLSTTAPE